MAERYYCANCLKIVTLNVHGHCEVCDSVSVMSMEKIQQALTNVSTQKSEAAVQPSTTIITPVMFGYIIEFRGFETFIGKNEAPSIDAAISIARDPLQRWYLRDSVGLNSGATKEISRNEYCDWIRKKG